MAAFLQNKQLLRITLNFNNFINMHKILKRIKKGEYANVIIFDKCNNAILRQLHHNALRRKFYLSKDQRGLFRRSITSAYALWLVLRTIWFIEQKD